MSWWCFTALSDARGGAIRFLQDHAGSFDGEARAAVLRAADVYAEENGMLGAVFGAKNAFLGPWSGKKFTDWTPAQRITLRSGAGVR